MWGYEKGNIAIVGAFLYSVASVIFFGKHFLSRLTAKKK
jgi:hypothetical protein